MILFNLSYLVFIFGVVNSASVRDDYILRYKDYKVYEIKSTEADVLELARNLTQKNEELSRDGEAPSIIVEGSRSELDVLVSPRALDLFRQTLRDRKLTATLIYDDYSQIIEIEKSNPLRSTDFSWTTYHGVDAIYDYLRNVSKTYPESVKLIVGGKSYEGRDLLGVQINTGTHNKGKKKVMFIESGIHAREWITPATTTYFINQLLTSKDANISALRDSFDWRIFPTVNPDGYHYSRTTDRFWRKTRSPVGNGCFGADPNRNWDHNWNTEASSSDPCDHDQYAGSKAFSEIETRSLSEYISSIENLLGYLSFHADGQMLLLPYSDSIQHVTINNYKDLFQIGVTSLKYGRKVNGAIYGGPATAAEILYAVSGGSMDWVREKLGTRLVYTYELRGTHFHWPPEKIYQQGDEVTQMLLGLAHEAAKLGYH